MLVFFNNTVLNVNTIAHKIQELYYKLVLSIHVLYKMMYFAHNTYVGVIFEPTEKHFVGDSGRCL